MHWLWKVYLIGACVTFVWMLRILQEGNKVTLGDLAWALFMSAFSWTGVLALWIGQNINRNRGM